MNCVAYKKSHAKMKNIKGLKLFGKDSRVFPLFVQRKADFVYLHRFRYLLLKCKLLWEGHPNYNNPNVDKYDPE